MKFFSEIPWPLVELISVLDGGGGTAIFAMKDSMSSRDLSSASNESLSANGVGGVLRALAPPGKMR